MMTATAHHWLPAAPFRSHVRALIDSSGLPWRAIALEARVPPGVVRTLLLGRDGRHRSKIPRLVAQNLLLLTEADLRRLRHRSVPPPVLRRLVRRLCRHGLTPDDVAVILRTEPAQIRAVAAGAACSSDAYTALLARAACDALCPDDSEAAYDDPADDGVARPGAAPRGSLAA